MLSPQDLLQCQMHSKCSVNVCGIKLQNAEFFTGSLPRTDWEHLLMIQSRQLVFENPWVRLAWLPNKRPPQKKHKTKEGPILFDCQESYYISWWEIQNSLVSRWWKTFQVPAQKHCGHIHPWGHGGHPWSLGWQLGIGGRCLHHSPLF